ncbi:MAG: HD domain-containing protein [Firmicutes bacterium]|nr:HD domain-containing protein [Bacillota bacterium]
MSEQPSLQDLQTGEAFVGFLLASEAAYKTSRTGGEYLEVKLLDRSGDIKGFLWDLRAVEGDFEAIRADVFLKVKAKVEEFQGRKQLRLEKVRFAEDAEVGDLSRFFPTSQRPVAAMLADMDGLIASIADPWIRKLLQAMLVENETLRAAFAKAPAAKSLHHVYLGGLLEHTLSVAGMAERACAHYSGINRDLLLAGVFLHDLGKTAELTYDRSFGYSDAGNLIGHISMEAEWISQEMARIPHFPEELRMQILHCVLSHHGKLEFGSPVLPKTPEALLLHYLDDLDGKLEGMFRAIRDESGSGNWTPFSRSLERMIYKVRWPKAVQGLSSGTQEP